MKLRESSSNTADFKENKHEAVNLQVWVSTEGSGRKVHICVITYTLVVSFITALILDKV